MRILGIETSCDETAAAVVVDGRQILANAVASQIALHRAHGGVVPELAARGHVTAMIPVVNEALESAGLRRAEIDAFAVTSGPGLASALLVGVNVAKTMAYLLDKPLIGVNHLEAHIYANWLNGAGEPPAFPVLCLLVSGGHTELILMEGHGRYRHLGRTIDDAAGEAFDKGARLLGLGYPGGPAIAVASVGGDETRFALPRAWLAEDSDDFSFSGLKTALLRLTEPYRIVESQPKAPSTALFPEHRPLRFGDDLPVADLAASFQAAIVDVLATKTARAARRHRVATVVLAGGVAANRLLRARVAEELRRVWDGQGQPPPLRFPDPALCTDNAAMIAGAGFFLWRRGVRTDLTLDAFPQLPLVGD